MFKDLPSGETHCDLIADAKQRALDLYKPPFRVASYRIMDDNGKFFTGYVGKDRGELIAEALNEHYAKRQKCAVHGYGCGMQEATCQSI